MSRWKISLAILAAVLLGFAMGVVIVSVALDDLMTLPR